MHDDSGFDYARFLYITSKIIEPYYIVVPQRFYYIYIVLMDYNTYDMSQFIIIKT